jgi:hypothetical protein
VIRAHLAEIVQVRRGGERRDLQRQDKFRDLNTF